MEFIKNTLVGALVNLLSGLIVFTWLSACCYGMYELANKSVLSGHVAGAIWLLVICTMIGGSVNE